MSESADKKCIAVALFATCVLSAWTGGGGGGGDGGGFIDPSAGVAAAGGRSGEIVQMAGPCGGEEVLAAWSGGGGGGDRHE